MNKKTLPILAGSAILTGLGVYLYASKVEAKNFKLETVRVTTYGGGSGSSSGNGNHDENHDKKIFRILHLSDTHLSDPESEKLRFLEEITDGAHARRADSCARGGSTNN
ncbi:MAG: hypothetical protein HYX67_00130 [Candidatus Melainabacteria bacterium]|nr:hypothetical protein [Candidatus Melainabacteria bacterium]